MYFFYYKEKKNQEKIIKILLRKKLRLTYLYYFHFTFQKCRKQLFFISNYTQCHLDMKKGKIFMTV